MAKPPHISDERGILPDFRGTGFTRKIQVHDRQQVPGNKGTTAIPTAAVVLSLCAQVALVQVWIDEQVLAQVYGVQAYHRLLCNALGLDSSWYEVPSAYKSGQCSQTP